jgi:hypothetical protein
MGEAIDDCAESHPRLALKKPGDIDAPWAGYAGNMLFDQLRDASDVVGGGARPARLSGGSKSLWARFSPSGHTSANWLRLATTGHDVCDSMSVLISILPGRTTRRPSHAASYTVKLPVTPSTTRQ